MGLEGHCVSTAVWCWCCMNDIGLWRLSYSENTKHMYSKYVYSHDYDKKV